MGGYETSHSIQLTDLTEDTTYFYAVEAGDQAGNSRTDNNGDACYTFTTADIPDYFTEHFKSDSDLDNLSLRFIPDASFDFYSGCAESIAALPVDQGGSTPLFLSDDSFALVILSGGETVSLYGNSYYSFYVGSNGYITFTLGDIDYTELLMDHFDLPRISALFDDFDPASGGTVSWKQLADRAVVTWDNVPEYGTTNSNTFQIEMHFDGTIVISYLDIAATDGIAGLSEGNGEAADFFESDLSAMSCDCSSQGECDDGLYCNGMETCDANGHCQPGTPVDCDDGVGCTNDSCNEGTDSCDNNPVDAECDDGLFCNGEETCDQAGDCQMGSDPCPNQNCDESIKACTDCNNDGICEPGEDCNNCPNDCISGGGGGICGNGVCEPVEGEDCISCPDDCNAKLGGKPSGRYCCGSDVRYIIDCNDPRCNDKGNTCMNDPVIPFCCGDGTCEGDEDSYNCEVDCGPPPVCGWPDGSETDCSDGVDNDCDGLVDGADPDCACLPRNEFCTDDGECCSNWCHRGKCK